MTTELTLLVCAIALAFIQMLVAVAGHTLQVGVPALAGNREGIAAPTGWAGRARRAHLNMIENLLLFAGLVLVAHAAGISTSMTVLGAQLFLWARLAYAIIYVVGIPWLRTAAWAVSVVGLILIFLQII
ncbi:membrane protein [Hypericibacter terrae]|jgi:uncharacterized MAPEG superfamily protein|uniref:Membrane protein n=1 Tax=Hypericibacter terrae TaxID=2602015 RepID=A0A5J6MEL0_9PROT|nr:MAPEG family protein [Hypericibacter terrae]QEX14815.1 membrane protein [Hypericibacter terrae]